MMLLKIIKAVAPISHERVLQHGDKHRPLGNVSESYSMDMHLLMFGFACQEWSEPVNLLARDNMLWSRVSSCGLLALEEVMSVPDICNVLARLF